METISLFPQGACDPVDRKADKAITAILALFAAGHPVVVAYSGGKDSSVVAALVLHVALLHHNAGGKPRVVVTTGDTLVESPEVSQHYHAELRRMRAFGKVHGISVSSTCRHSVDGIDVSSEGAVWSCAAEFSWHPRRLFDRSQNRAAAQLLTTSRRATRMVT